EPHRQNERGDQVKIFADLGGQLNMNGPLAHLLHGEEKPHGERHDDEENKRASQNEEDRRRDKKGKERLTLVPVKAGGDEHIELCGEHRERQHDRTEKGNAELCEKELLRSCVNQVDPRLAANGDAIGDQQEIIDILRENIANGKEN